MGGTLAGTARACGAGGPLERLAKGAGLAETQNRVVLCSPSSPPYDVTKYRRGRREQGPVRLAEDLIDLIKTKAVEKRQRLGNNAETVSITVALIGDSRTGKSETAEKMEGILSLELV